MFENVINCSLSLSREQFSPGVCRTIASCQKNHSQIWSKSKEKRKNEKKTRTPKTRYHRCTINFCSISVLWITNYERLYGLCVRESSQSTHSVFIYWPPLVFDSSPWYSSGRKFNIKSWWSKSIDDDSRTMCVESVRKRFFGFSFGSPIHAFKSYVKSEQWQSIRI